MLHLLLTIVVLGFLLYLVERFIPMSEIFQTLLRFVVVVLVIYELVTFLGVRF